jgi:hypothetical protein
VPGKDRGDDVLEPDVLVVMPGVVGLTRPTTGRVLPTAKGGAPILASISGEWMRCSAWAMSAGERKALADRLRCLACLVETCVPDEAESRVCSH